jgi:argininosuccinate lyase
LELAAPIVATAQLDREAIAASIDRGHLDATALMEYLILRGTPQRRAHELVGNLVRKALDADKQLAELPLSAFHEADPTLDEGVYQVLGARQAVMAFVSYGSTAPAQVEKQIAAWRQKLNV